MPWTLSADTSPVVIVGGNNRYMAFSKLFKELAAEEDLDTIKLLNLAASSVLFLKIGNDENDENDENDVIRCPLELKSNFSAKSAAVCS